MATERTKDDAGGLTGRSKASASSRSDDVGEHYDRWPFPGIDHGSREGLILLRTLTAWLADSPTSGGAARVIDVGCGTGHTTVALARHFPGVEFVGLDLVDAEIEAARGHAMEVGADNVAFRCGDVCAGGTRLGEFSVVLCLGVLHHIPDQASAFARIARLAAPGGHLVLWVYGRFGRFPHRLNQEFLRMLLGEAGGAEALSVARAFLADMGQRFAIDSGFYTPFGSGDEGVEWLLDQPQWLADQMIPAHEQAFTMRQILALFDEHSLRFTKWLGMPVELDRFTARTELLERFAALPPRERLVALDLLIKPAYYFVAARRIAALE